MRPWPQASAFRLGAALVTLLSLGLTSAARTPAGEDANSVPSTQKQGARVAVRRRAIHSAPIQVDVNLVVVNVTVTDPYDRIVTGLEQGNFRVFDEKVEQQIAAFSTEDAPISVGLIFDSSGSMGDKIQKSKEAALQFFKTSNPQDEFMLINFSDRPRTCRTACSM
jgi:Ca-activated chloride channel family protein